MQSRRTRIALVIPWFGKELKGGAEQLAWQIASRLNQREVELTVLTTCSSSFLSDWSRNELSEGEFVYDGINIKRFKVKKSSTRKFGIANQKLLSVKKPDRIFGCSPVNEIDEQSYLDENLFSPDLQYYIETNHSHYDLFLFLPYLFPNVIKGCHAVREKAILQPCLHDESYAYLPSVAQMHLDAKRLFFNSVGEFELAKRMYGPSIINRSRVVYSGIETPAFDSVEYQRHILSLGRRDTGKGTDLLIKSFDRFIRETGSDMKLYIAGVGDLPVLPQSANIVDLGMVPDEKKDELLKTCSALINPSSNESFSRVIFESWSASKPVIVNKDCLATYTALEDSGMAGFAASDEESFVQIFKELADSTTEQLAKLGEQGKKYAARVTNWDSIIDTYIEEFEAVLAEKNVQEKKNITVHQLMPGFDVGDAVSNQAIAISQQLKEMGYENEIHAQHISEKLKHLATGYKKGCMKPNDILLYHHSIGFEHTEEAINFEGKKALIYHNITPKDFFEPYDGEFAVLLDEGRQHLADLAKSFPLSYSDSQFNAEELLMKGFVNSSVLPLVIDPERWNFKADEITLRNLNDGRKNILFTGRVAPNKKQTDLVKLVPHLLSIDPDIRVCIVGQNFGIGAAYVDELYRLIEDLGVSDSVWIAGKLKDSELKAAFMSADLYFSPSEHEGFGVPLIEAMWFDIPVLAYKSTAVPETLDTAAFMIDEKKNLPYNAVLIHKLLTDQELRSDIIKAQRVVRERYTLEKLKPIYEQMLSELVNE